MYVRVDDDTTQLRDIMTVCVKRTYSQCTSTSLDDCVRDDKRHKYQHLLTPDASGSSVSSVYESDHSDDESVESLSSDLSDNVTRDISAELDAFYTSKYEDSVGDVTLRPVDMIYDYIRGLPASACDMQSLSPAMRGVWVRRLLPLFIRRTYMLLASEPPSMEPLHPGIPLSVRTKPLNDTASLLVNSLRIRWCRLIESNVSSHAKPIGISGRKSEEGRLEWTLEGPQDWHVYYATVSPYLFPAVHEYFATGTTTTFVCIQPATIDVTVTVDIMLSGQTLPVLVVTRHPWVHPLLVTPAEYDTAMRRELVGPMTSHLYLGDVWQLLGHMDSPMSKVTSVLRTKYRSLRCLPVSFSSDHLALFIAAIAAGDFDLVRTIYDYWMQEVHPYTGQYAWTYAYMIVTIGLREGQGRLVFEMLQYYHTSWEGLFPSWVLNPIANAVCVYAELASAHPEYNWMGGVVDGDTPPLSGFRDPRQWHVWSSFFSGTYWHLEFTRRTLRDNLRQTMHTYASASATPEYVWSSGITEALTWYKRYKSVYIRPCSFVLDEKYDMRAASKRAMLDSLNEDQQVTPGLCTILDQLILSVSTQLKAVSEHVPDVLSCFMPVLLNYAFRSLLIKNALESQPDYNWHRIASRVWTCKQGPWNNLDMRAPSLSWLAQQTLVNDFVLPTMKINSVSEIATSTTTAGIYSVAFEEIWQDDELPGESMDYFPFIPGHQLQGSCYMLFRRRLKACAASPPDEITPWSIRVFVRLVTTSLAFADITLWMDALTVPYIRDWTYKYGLLWVVYWWKHYTRLTHPLQKIECARYLATQTRALSNVPNDLSVMVNYLHTQFGRVRVNYHQMQLKSWLTFVAMLQAVGVSAGLNRLLFLLFLGDGYLLFQCSALFLDHSPVLLRSADTSMLHSLTPLPVPGSAV